MRSTWICLYGCAVLLAFGTCGFGQPLRVVTLHSVLTEIARDIGGDSVDVKALVRPGVDPHVYEPTPTDIRSLQTAEIVLASGLGLESYLPRIARELPEGIIVNVGDRLPDNLKLDCADHAHAESSTVNRHHHGEIDPHWWQGIEPMIAATRIVESEFMLLRPAQSGTFSRNADAYRDRLRALQGWARQEVARLPIDRRLLVTSHDAFGYLAREHGFILYPILGTDTATDTSARQLAFIITIVRRNHIKAVFAERSGNSRLIQTVVRETGAALAPPLCADGLSPDPAFATYDLMMRTNLRTIVDALR